MIHAAFARCYLQLRFLAVRQVSPDRTIAIAAIKYGRLGHVRHHGDCLCHGSVPRGRQWPFSITALSHLLAQLAVNMMFGNVALAIGLRPEFFLTLRVPEVVSHREPSLTFAFGVLKLSRGMMMIFLDAVGVFDV